MTFFFRNIFNPLMRKWENGQTHFQNLTGNDLRSDNKSCICKNF